MPRTNRPRKLRRLSATPYVLGAVAFTVALGVVGFAVPRTVESREPAEIRVARDFDTVLLPVPARAVSKGESLTNVEFVSIKWPKHHLTEQYVSSPDGLNERFALTALAPYVPVPKAAIGNASGDANAVVGRIPEGMRAITVRVDLESAVEGWAQSENYVDVLLLRQGKDVQDGMEAKVIAENVRILSAGRSAEPAGSAGAPRPPATVTLLVRQEEALKIKTAASIGKLAFSLRGIGDQQPTTARTLNQRELLGGQFTKLPLKERRKGFAKGPDGRTYVLATGEEWIPEARGTEDSSESR